MNVALFSSCSQLFYDLDSLSRGQTSDQGLNPGLLQPRTQDKERSWVRGWVFSTDNFQEFTYIQLFFDFCVTIFLNLRKFSSQSYCNRKTAAAYQDTEVTDSSSTPPYQCLKMKDISVQMSVSLC